ncbi:MAG: glycoside hydrolase family 73 protein [Streptococcus sp.]
MRRRFKLKAFIILVAVFALGILLPLILHASTADNARTVKVAYTQKGFIENLAPTAQKMSKNYGVPASILLSQAAYESNYGSSLLSVKYHNIYSLPARVGQEHIYLKDNVYSKGKWQYQKVDFAVFRDWSSSMSSYLEELRQGRWGESTYKEVAGTTSYKVAAEKLQAAGFNSDPDYTKHLISIIETYNLVKYDR